MVLEFVRANRVWFWLALFLVGDGLRWYKQRKRAIKADGHLQIIEEGFKLDKTVDESEEEEKEIVMTLALNDYINARIKDNNN